MVVHNEREALCVAVEMENRAIRIYERAMLLVDDEAIREGIETILQQEKQHLKRFKEMRERHPVGLQEEKMLLQAMGAEVLFPGGVMEMERAHGFTTLKGLYSFAAQSERQAIDTYVACAEKCQDKGIAEAFRSIAAEESVHLAIFQEHESR